MNTTQRINTITDRINHINDSLIDCKRIVTRHSTRTRRRAISASDRRKIITQPRKDRDLERWSVEQIEALQRIDASTYDSICRLCIYYARRYRDTIMVDGRLCTHGIADDAIGLATMLFARNPDTAITKVCRAAVDRIRQRIKQMSRTTDYSDEYMTTGVEKGVSLDLKIDTKQQQQVVDLLAEELTHQQIAERLNVSRQRVGKIIEQIREMNSAGV